VSVHDLDADQVIDIGNTLRVDVHTEPMARLPCIAIRCDRWMLLASALVIAR